MYYADESGLLHKSVYSNDGKKLGFVKQVFLDNIIIQSEFTWLRKYLVPKSTIASISKESIELKITAYEVRYRYSHTKLKNTIIPLEIVKRTYTSATTKLRIFHDIYESIRYSRWQRNQSAAVISFVSGIMFLISGYRADVTLYYSIQKEVLANLPNNISTVVIIPIGVLIIISQLGGITGTCRCRVVCSK
jgi:sporulation protein YlmC with PRC-barrel domain